ncbi:hypothetical protein FIBSPDRAFT_405126, partial [Athelia psychrophila]
MFASILLDANQLLLLCLLLVALYVGLNSKRPKHPPGPRGLPLIGNLLDMPTSEDWLQYRKWSEEFSMLNTWLLSRPKLNSTKESDVIYLNIFGTHMVVTNTLESTLDLLERRSSKYSSRTRMPMLVELIGMSWSFSFMPYGDTWRAHRRLAAQEFDSSQTIPKYELTFTRNAHGLLR